MTTENELWHHSSNCRPFVLSIADRLQFQTRILHHWHKASCLPQAATLPFFSSLIPLCFTSDIMLLKQYKTELCFIYRHQGKAQGMHGVNAICKGSILTSSTRTPRRPGQTGLLPRSPLTRPPRARTHLTLYITQSSFYEFVAIVSYLTLQRKGAMDRLMVGVRAVEQEERSCLAGVAQANALRCSKRRACMGLMLPYKVWRPHLPNENAAPSQTSGISAA